MSAVLLGVFLASAALLWLSTCGYLFFLRALRVFRRRPQVKPAGAWPPIAVVVPTLNEEADIRAKLEDLRRSDYPADKIRWAVVDGGSRDRTAEAVLEEAAGDERLELIRLPQARGKADQIRTTLHRLREDIVVFTDADSRLHPSCIRELVGEIQGEGTVALAAAMVCPETPLLEERLHWMFLNRLWRLEGEALSCSGLSGVCFALHRMSFLSMAAGARADDAHLGVMACTRGMRVVMSARARATELRAPHTSREFMSFRKRRGSCYLSELLRGQARKFKSASWRLTGAVRIWQMTGLPWVLAATLLSGTALVFTRFRIYSLAVISGLTLAAFIYALALSRREPRAPSPFKLAPALVKYAVLLFLSLFLLENNPARQGPRGGE